MIWFKASDEDLFSFNSNIKILVSVFKTISDRPKFVVSSELGSNLDKTKNNITMTDNIFHLALFEDHKVNI